MARNEDMIEDSIWLRSKEEQKFIIEHNIMIKNLGVFEKWLNLKYQASKEYGDVEEWGVWEEVINKFDELFNEN
jgi:hypothetical protein